MNLQKKMLQEAKITERNSNGENGDPEHLSDEDHHREALAKPETMIVSFPKNSNSHFSKYACISKYRMKIPTNTKKEKIQAKLQVTKNQKN